MKQETKQKERNTSNKRDTVRSATNSCPTSSTFKFNEHM